MPTSITSIHNPRIKLAAALRNRRTRDERGLAIVHGARETQRALAAGAQMVEAFLCTELLGNEEARRVAERLVNDPGCYELTVEVFKRLAYGDRLDGVICVVQAITRGLDGLALPANPLIAVIEGSEKPGNLGAILRTADGAGVDAVLLVDPVIDLFNPNTIRASIGTAFNANIAVTTGAKARQWLLSQGIRCFGLRPHVQQDYCQADLTGATAILIGNEASGLSDAWNDGAVTAVSIPMRGIADSLNASVAAAVMFYEARRQRAAAR